jgi:hypothetical protein
MTGRAISVLAAALAAMTIGLATAASIQKAAPPNRPLMPFGDMHNWIVLEPVVYVIGDTSDRIVVPAGFVTDLASIPRAFWGPPFYLTPAGQYGRAAIIHDYLYWSQKCSRDQADRLLIIAMKESNVGTFDEDVIYRGVQIGGLTAWINNADDMKRGLPRILPEPHRHPDDPNMNWPTYSQQLMDTGIKSLPVNDDGGYCRYGDSTNVPHKI